MTATLATVIPSTPFAPSAGATTSRTRAAMARALNSVAQEDRATLLAEWLTRDDVQEFIAQELAREVIARNERALLGARACAADDDIDFEASFVLDNASDDAPAQAWSLFGTSDWRDGKMVARAEAPTTLTITAADGTVTVHTPDAPRPRGGARPQVKVYASDGERAQAQRDAKRASAQRRRAAERAAREVEAQERARHGRGGELAID